MVDVTAHSVLTSSFDLDTMFDRLAPPNGGEPDAKRIFQDNTSSSPSYIPPIDLETCIEEEKEKEEEDAELETESENGDPITPTELSSPQPESAPFLHDDLSQALDGTYKTRVPSLPTPNNPQFPKPSPQLASKGLYPQQATPLPSQTIPTTPSSTSKRSFLFFRRSNSQQVMPALKLGVPQNGASDTNLTNLPKRIFAARRTSANNSAQNSAGTTRSNSPTSPGPSPSYPEAISEANRKRNRSSVSTFSHIKQKVTSGFGHHGKAESIANGDIQKRSTSFDLKNVENLMVDTPKQDDAPANTTLGHRQPWGLPAQYGTGTKARRLSLSVADDFNVDVGELHKEFSDQSKLIGKRGKLLGRGATSRVALMVGKGGPSTELYAVKEFRGKQSNEDAAEYDNKIKSEYCISKSLHHPNIVETFRLCKDHGRWNHVMEYCEQGDLFNLVKQGHLKAEDRLPDRLCLFKQLIQGVNYLHSHGIAHRDIKLENLLVTSQSKLKITDFGVSEVFSGIHPGMSAAGGQCGKEMSQEIRLCCPGICGSEPYIAPEVLEKIGDYDPRPLDVWSSAIVVLHIIFGGALWNRAKLNDGQVQYEKVYNGWQKFNASPSGTENTYPYVDAFDRMIRPPALRKILLSMLNPDPKARITIAEVAKKGWVKSIECCQPDSLKSPVVVIDVEKGCDPSVIPKVARHNHLMPHHSKAHGIFVRTPGSTAMDC